MPDKEIEASAGQQLAISTGFLLYRSFVPCAPRLATHGKFVLTESCSGD